MAGKATAQAERHGSRWLHKEPSGDEVASWFVQNAPVHEGLEPERYVGGVTLIPAKMKPKVVAENGAIVDGSEQLVYTPYVKVETRVAYFWDLMQLHPEWVGAVEEVPAEKLKAAGMTNIHLPPGFFRMPMLKADGKTVEYIGQSVRVKVYRADTLQWVDQWASNRKTRVLEGVPVMAPSPGTKVVPVLNKYGEDPFAVMKAETGALGRALGMAGMLVVPGSGVATAEDIQEAMERPGGVGANLPGDPADFADQAEGATAAQTPAADLKARAEELLRQLGEEHPGKLEEVQAWAKERKLNLSELTPESPALRGVVKQLEKKLAEADDGDEH
jgi:hypothetical protein